MTIIRSNSISGINSITAAPGANLQFFDSTGASLSLDTGNVNAGVVTATTVRVTGDLTVEGTTTTLDTVVTEVDKLEVNANNSTVGVAITQSGAGDILRLYDGASQVVTVDDQGNFGIGNTTPNAKLKVSGDAIFTQTSASIQTDCLQLGFTAPNGFIKSKNSSASPASNLDFYSTDTGGNTNLGIRLKYTGNVGIGSDNPSGKLDIQGNFEGSSNFALRFVNTKGTGRTYGFRSHGTNGEAFTLYHGSIRMQSWNDYQPGGNTVFYSGGTESFRIHNNGNIGIGTDNPQARLHVNTTIDDNDAPQWAFHLTQDDPSNAFNQVGGSGIGILFKPATNSVPAIGAGIAAEKPGASDDDTTTDLVFYTSQNDETLDEAARFTSAGNLKFPSGQGIDFSATADGSGTTTSELLDDYEEGTWTPIDNSAGLTFSTADGRYVKIGSIVHCWGRVQYPSTSNTSNNAIGGFPFTNLWTNPVNYSGNITITNFGSADILPMIEDNELRFRNYSNNTFNNSQLSGKFMYFEFDLRT